MRMTLGHFVRRLVALGASGVCLAWPVVALATPNVTSVAGNPAPLRFVKGSQVSPRSQNLNPLGLNYYDCLQDMQLQFSVYVTGFDGGETLQVWASRSGSCQTDSARAVASSGVAVPSCWLIDSQLTGQVINGQSVTFNLRAQDIIGPATPPAPPTQVQEGSGVCSGQTTFTAVPMTISFVPVNSGSFSVDGTGFDYTNLSADLVGPPAPTGVNLALGDTLLIANWTPNIDSDTGGYDIFVDPPPGMPVAASAADANLPDAPGTTVTICPDSSTSAGGAATEAGATDEGGATTEAGATDEGGATTEAGATDEGGATDAASASADAASSDLDAASGCYNASLPTSGGCTSTNLVAAILDDASTSTTTVAADSGSTDGSTTTTTGTGGTATIDCRYLVGTSCPAGSPVYVAQSETVSGEPTGQYLIKGLTNGANYNVVIAAVDNFGNVGPPSPQACEQPQPVNDFFTLYKNDKGGGGGFCAIEAAGMSRGSPILAAGFGIGVAAAVRRRRSRRDRAARSRGR